MPRIAGAAVGAIPDYLGSNDYEVGIAPFFRYQFEGSKRYVQLLGAEVTFNVLDHPNLRFGPLVNYHFGRDDDVEDEVVARMREIDGTVEMGAFLDWFYIVEPGNPRHRLVAGGAIEQDVGNESDGLRGRISARYWRPVTEAIDVYIGGGMQFADSDYVETYFGVDAADAAATGLPQFSPSGGVNDVRLNLGALFYLSREWLLAAGLQYRRLLDDAADSPIVDDRGSANQVYVGVGAAYLW